MERKQDFICPMLLRCNRLAPELGNVNARILINGVLQKTLLLPATPAFRHPLTFQPYTFMRRILSKLFLVAAFVWAVLPAQAQRNGFGAAVAFGDAEAIVAEPGNLHTPGKVYVFGMDGAEWTEQAALHASDGFVGDAFGSALALDGNRLLVGAAAQADGQGAVYVFERNDAGTWMETGRLTANAGQASAGYGVSVALDGDWALVGASSYGDDGAVFAYRHNGSMWEEVGMWTNGEEDTQDQFGASVALHNGRAIVGAPGTPASPWGGGNDESTTGAAYAFAYDAASDTWSAATKIMGSQADDGSMFGAQVTMMDDVALIAAPRVNRSAGAVFAFTFDEMENAWTEQNMLVPFDLQPQYRFGSSISLSAEGAWVGAPGGRRSSHSGAAYFMSWENGQWTGVDRVVPAEAQNGDSFGTAIAGNGMHVVVGATGDDFGAGTASVMHVADGAWSQAAKLASEVSSFDRIAGNMVSCEGGQAEAFDCDNMDLASFMPISELGGARGVRLNDIWGWTDPETDNEYALVGRMDGTSFVDVTDPYNPIYVGELPATEGSRPNTWRDMKVYNNHIFVVADNAGEHGMQIFDMTQLRGLDGSNPVSFKEDALYRGVHSAHNVVINEDTGYAYIVGASGGGQSCGGGLHMVNIQDPLNPVFEGCFSDTETGRRGTGYSHDAQCVVYNGPDTEHQGKEICFGSNETALSVADVTDKANPVALSNAAYPNAAYTHQGWLTEDQRYFYINDELDELGGNVTNTRTIIWDVSDLDDPELVKEYMLSTEASDHNLYIRGNTMYQSNYYSGLRILDITDPENPVESGFFDTMPFSDAAGFDGSWSNYPYFKSGNIIVSSISQGLFVIKKRNLGI